MAQNDTDVAFQYLNEAFSINPNLPGLYSCFEDLFRLKIRLHNDPVDRMGLASLLSDVSRYEEAANELRGILGSESETSRLDPTLRKKATSTLFRLEAAICAWDSYETDSAAMLDSVREDLALGRIPSVHPYEALMWPCLSLKDASEIAEAYAKRAMGGSAETNKIPSMPNGRERVEATAQEYEKQTKKIRLGYISPDFTGKHPLAFLMQDMFRFHDTSRFEVYVYSLKESDLSPEVEKIKGSATKWTVLPSTTDDIVGAITADKLNILVDLCGYTGTALIAEVMAHRPAPIQIAYMGFPASSRAPFIDFMICDQIVVPPTDSSIRNHYSENLIYMPHCYFVNSHKYLLDSWTRTPKPLRSDHGLPEFGFNFCCHSRPEKIDPMTFRSWLKVLKNIREEGTLKGEKREANAFLWLLRTGVEMEENLRQISRNEFGLEEDALVFANKAPRNDHLHRLQLADLFLDTPAYNAHTVGVDCLGVGVPMVSLLRHDDSTRFKTTTTTTTPMEGVVVDTEKLASRVGASLLYAAGLPELVAPTMLEYEGLMKQCSTDPIWFATIKDKLSASRCAKVPLFDTPKWVKHLEVGLLAVEASSHRDFQKRHLDVFVMDSD